uniref:NADH-ubiquinone oxidoreductase chain 5 n=1 Tax=Orussus occidentalis TaxID=576952 RepID=C4NCF0_ORUOC|nr:NADH dehydrogenase subunit 5 [Orussus occidentalis]ACJ69701.1 NADH dehydrogenase subunit 5 [Orussus occidentalis]
MVLYMFFLWMMFFCMGIYFYMNSKVIFLEWLFLDLGIDLDFLVYLDWMTFIFLSVIMLIGSMVIMYSCEYMADDINISRFILLILMFIMVMVFMIISPSTVSILLGWDGLGLVSYCLVIYYQNSNSFNSGMLTFISNRVGDVMILLSILFLVNMNSLTFNLFNMIDYMSSYLMVLIFVAGITKSAQIPFSSWLPAAMAAPTPVSSLVHSSTLVTAGVYLLIRYNLIYMSDYSSFYLYLCMLTMLFASLFCNYEYDLKKIIALSTLSQLGLMMSFLFIGESLITFFHLVMHAMFKALLFMCAGYIIHKLKYQDIRMMGCLGKVSPYVMGCYMISNFSLCGLTFLSGFFSKDLILQYLLMENLNITVVLIFFFSSGLTVSYTMRMLYYCMNDNNSSDLLPLSKDVLGPMAYSMLILALCSVMMGKYYYTLMMFGVYIYISSTMMMIIYPMMIVGGLMGYYLFSYGYCGGLYCLSSFLGSMFYMTNISVMFNGLIYYLGGFFSFKVDKGYMEIYGSYGIMSFINMMNKYDYYMSNTIMSYFFYFIYFMVIFMFF